MLGGQNILIWINYLIFAEFLYFSGLFFIIFYILFIYFFYIYFTKKLSESTEHVVSSTLAER